MKNLKQLSWSPDQAEASAVIAFSNLYWRGVPKYDAIDSILVLPEASFLRENPFVLYSAWERVSREITGESVLVLELEPIFDTAA